MQSDNNQTGANEPDEGVSRRRIIGGVGVAVAGGLVAGLAGASPASAGTSGGGTAATGRPGDTVFEFVCQIEQNGADFTGLGYLTAIAGLDPETLFTGEPRDETHARYLLTADGHLVARSVDGAVHSLNIEGQLAIHYSQSGGANWANPPGFAVGGPIATYDLELQDVLTVILPVERTGIPTLNGVATQNGTGRANGRPFGRPNMTTRFTATGIGTRSDTSLMVEDAMATLTVAGSMIAT
jgi:hypothetical protein